MNLSDLKVVSANIQVDNSNQTDGKYRISASFRTQNGEMKGVDGGLIIVKDNGKHATSFYKNIEFEDSLHVTYMNEPASDVAVQSEINQIINEFVAVATAVAIEETND